MMVLGFVQVVAQQLLMEVQVSEFKQAVTHHILWLLG